eukprot:TRINITY_DN1281_c1_g1_i1.p1 TRINITY_DN1281_c1_g1~~TRINITY_DN1281_c1_g1_i1.p1  ORF type:complete len:523 (+),score=80.27 TRINITY_DN1281_c1_g1_i1:1868-3436(+)
MKVPKQWDLILCSLTVLFCILVAPYNKVEESFNTQATHDIIYYKWNLDKYDHQTYPGVVPRTFIGAFMLAIPGVLASFIFAKTQMAIVIRVILGSYFVGTLWIMRGSIAHRFGNLNARFFLLFTTTQFHLQFYCSRTLPNSFALMIFMCAFSEWVHRRYYKCLAILTFTAVVFRCDLLVFICPLVLFWILTGRIHFWKGLWTGIVIACVSLIFTVAVDTLMWGRPMWPEGQVLMFNTIQNKSSEWGIMPFHWYFTSALPKSLLSTILFIIPGLLQERSMMTFFIPVLAFISLYSILLHKELRFIIYAIPVINLVASAGCSYVWNLWREGSRYEKTMRFLARLFVICCFLGNAVLSLVFLRASVLNYPGGEAITKLPELHDAWLSGYNEELQMVSDTPTVHISVLAAMTGVSRFTEPQEPWIVSKKEDMTREEYDEFLYLITDTPSHYEDTFRTIYTQYGFSHLSLKESFVLAPKLYIMQNKMNMLNMIEDHWGEELDDEILNEENNNETKWNSTIVQDEEAE